jgi:hypothetical protein
MATPGEDVGSPFSSWQLDDPCLKIELSFRQSELHFCFAHLSFANSHRPVYSYRPVSGRTEVRGANPNSS